MRVRTSRGQIEIDESVEPDIVTDRTIERDDVPDKWEFAVFDAEDFVIHGPASVQQVDRQGQQIQMDALGDAIDRYFESREAPGIISLEHKDVPIGVPIREWTFDDGSTVRSHIDGDVMYLVGNIANDTEKAKEARYRALTGDLDGYSVTVYSKEEGMVDGTRVTTACDLHAVTLGSDEKIVNPDAQFEVVDYKQWDNRFVPRLIDRLDQKSDENPYTRLLSQKLDRLVDLGPGSKTDQLQKILLQIARSSAPISEDDPGFRHAITRLNQGDLADARRLIDEYIDDAPGFRQSNMPQFTSPVDTGDFGTDQKRVEWNSAEMSSGAGQAFANRLFRKHAKAIEIKIQYQRGRVTKQQAMSGLEELRQSDLVGDDYRKTEQWLEKPIEDYQ